MQWSLFLFILMGQCFLYSGRLFEYRLIKTKKTWNEARAHCRNKYSDLATVTDVDDTQRLKDMMRRKNITDAWIGLRSYKGRENSTWHWSLPGVESNETQFKEHWGDNQPGDEKNNENCALMKTSDRKWHDNGCGHSSAFICYKDTGPGNSSFHEIDEKKPWLQAQKHCREHHTDLISGVHQLEKFKLDENSGKDYLWIGLFRDTWRWSDESDFSFRNWTSGQFKDGTGGNECATVTHTSGEWSSADCDESKPFFCYDDKAVLVQEKMNWEDALYHCQDKYDDLVTIIDAAEQRWVQAKAKKATTSHVWLGLRYTCTLDFWFWVSDAVVVYENWGPGEENNGCDMSGAMSREWPHEWFKKPDGEGFNFICSKR